MSDAARLEIPPVRKAVTVPCRPEEAFRMFAAECRPGGPSRPTPCPGRTPSE